MAARNFRALAYAAPSALTLTALACSLTAMRAARSGQFPSAAGLIISAAVCDALDGHVARLLDTVTVFGGELDSLGDLVNFGVAPALVMHAWAEEDRGEQGDTFLWVCCVIFCQACALRLARFNCSPGGPAHAAAAAAGEQLRQPSEGSSMPAADGKFYIARSKFFSGVPAPMGAMMALLPLFWELETGDRPFGRPTRQEVACPTLLVTAVLMVSNLKTLSSKMLMRDPKKASHLRISSPWEAMLKGAGVFGAAMAVWTSPWRMVLVLAMGYVLSLFVGPLVYTCYAK